MNIPINFTTPEGYIGTVFLDWIVKLFPYGDQCEIQLGNGDSVMVAMSREKFLIYLKKQIIEWKDEVP